MRALRPERLGSLGQLGLCRPHWKRKWALRAALGVALTVMEVACASGGRRFDPDSVPAIQRGRWTQREVKARFGEPTGTFVRGSGFQVWKYRFEERRTGDTGTLVRIGAFIAALFGRPFIGSPVNVRTSNATVYSLDVEFDKRGVVTDYTYSREQRPNSEVY